MLGDHGTKDPVSSFLERGQRASLILLHEPAVTDNIGGQNSREAALDAPFSHPENYNLEIFLMRLYG